MTLYQLDTVHGGKVRVRYVQRVEGVMQCKADDDNLYYLGQFKCNDNFIKLCDEFDLWDCRRDNSIPSEEAGEAG